jgi:polysaccharide biosynthesis/export protein
MLSLAAVVAALCALLLLGGTSAHAQAPAQAPALTTPVRPGAVSPAPAGSQPAEYRLGAGDVVRIVVFQNPELTLETRITETGVISYPLLGVVRLGGMSITDAERSLADGLKNGNFLKNPQVTLIVLQVRGHQASVLGQVNRPGRYPIEMADMRLTDLLALAGGTAPGGSDVVIVTGTRNGQPFRQEVDLPTLFSPAGGGKDLMIINGDTAWVDRQPLVYIYGEVQRPGPMRLEREMTLLQALATGGGLTQRGTDKGIKVHRKGPDGKVQVIEPAMTDGLRDGDVVFVRESLF